MVNATHHMPQTTINLSSLMFELLMSMCVNTYIHERDSYV